MSGRNETDEKTCDLAHHRDTVALILGWHRKLSEQTALGMADAVLRYIAYPSGFDYVAEHAAAEDRRRKAER